MMVFYSHYAGEPDFNMGFDEYLLQRTVERPHRLHIRLYTWSEGTITIGYNQRFESAVDLQKLGKTPLIRRVTGGRALFHDLSEITYSLAWDTELCPSPCLRQPGTGAFNSVSEALVAFLRRLGRSADIVRASGARDASPDFFHKAPCFASRARWEVVSAGRKIVASAARRYGSAVLQHGAIKLGGTAAHPALDLEPTSAQALRRIDSGEFAQLAGEFECEMSHSLGLNSTPGAGQETASNADNRLRHRVDYVKRNRFEQRDIFERRACDDSLYRGGSVICRQKRA